MYIVWLFLPSGAARDYQFKRWDSAIAFMVELAQDDLAYEQAFLTPTYRKMHSKDEYLSNATEWELTYEPR